MRQADRRNSFSPSVDPIQAKPDLIDRLCARDGSAYEELVRTHATRMLAVATRYLPNPSDAEDAVQEAFANVFRSVATFERLSTLDTWLHRIVVNCALTTLRRRRRRPESLLDDATLAEGATTRWRGSPPPTAHRLVEDDEAMAQLCRAVGRLPRAQRSVFALRDVESRSMTEVAGLLDVGVSTVKTRLHRARRSLQRTLGSQLGESVYEGADPRRARRAAVSEARCRDPSR